jgi:hypothetical protein
LPTPPFEFAIEITCADILLAPLPLSPARHKADLVPHGYCLRAEKCRNRAPFSISFPM